MINVTNGLNNLQKTQTTSTTPVQKGTKTQPQPGSASVSMMSFSSAEALKAYNLNDLKKDYAGRLTVTTVDPSKFSDGNGIIFLPEDAAPTSLSNPGDASIYKLDGSKYLVKQETQEDSVVSAVLKQENNEQVGTIKKYNGNDDIDVAVSSGKPGQTIYVRYPNGLTAIIPAGGSFKQEGVVEAAMGKGVSKLASKTTFEPNFKGNLVVTTGFEPQKAMKAVDEYFENGMVTKVTDDLTHISTEDVDVLVLTAGFGTRIKDLTREVGEIKPTLGSPAEGERFVHNALENATRAGLIDKDTKAQFLHDPEISGSASHLLLAYRSGLVKGDKPVLVLSSDHIHDIDFKKAIDFYKEKEKSDQPPLAVVLSHPVSRQEIRDLGAIKAGGETGDVIKEFVEKPKDNDEEAEKARIPGTDMYRANTGIYLFSPDSIKLLDELEPKLRSKNPAKMYGLYDFGSHVFGTLSDLANTGKSTETWDGKKTPDGKELKVSFSKDDLKTDIGNRKLYTCDNPVGTYWKDGGGSVNEYLNTLVEVASDKSVTLPKSVRADYDKNVDIKNRSACFADARPLLDEVVKQYGPIQTENVIFVKRA